MKLGSSTCDGAMFENPAFFLTTFTCCTAAPMFFLEIRMLYHEILRSHFFSAFFDLIESSHDLLPKAIIILVVTVSGTGDRQHH